MKSFIVCAIAALASFTTASPVLQRRDNPKTFKLKPAPDAPAEVAGLGYVQWDGTLGGNLGWFPDNENATDVSTFIQYNAKDGIAFYSRNTALEIYLRPTHGTPMYFTKLGNPEQDSTPALTLSSNFTLDCESDGEYFGYNHSKDNWIACGSGSSYTLYFGPGSGSGCTAGFNLVAEKYDDGMWSR